MEESGELKSLLRRWNRREENVLYMRETRAKKGKFGYRRMGSTKSSQKENFLVSSSASEKTTQEVGIKGPAHQFILPPLTIDLQQPSSSQSIERLIAESTQTLEQGVQDFIVPSDGLSDKVSNKKSSKSWSQRSQEIYEAWEQVMREYFEAFVSSNGFKVSHCYTCRCSLSTFYIHCNQCIQDFCSECDILEHQRHPFHHRILNKPNPLETKVLGQMEFINDSGSIKHMKVAVTCRLPLKCGSENCGKEGTNRLKPGNDILTIITKDGRFDLLNATFECAECNFRRAATTLEYIASRWWPASPKSSNRTFFCMSMLDSWYFLLHKTPGTSERKYLEVLEECSKLSNRKNIISRELFGTSFRRYRQLVYWTETEIKLRPLFKCLACGNAPKAFHIDGLRKLYRRKSAAGLNHPPLLGFDAIFSPDELSAHRAKIDAVKPVTEKSKQRDSCGGATYRAGKEDSSASKGLDKTGMVFATCRHSFLWKAVDMDVGETYRHVHLLHDFALKNGAKIICYDVICQYWPFALDLAAKNSEFRSHVDEMDPMESEFHGQTHSWQCQMEYGGHLLKGAALTTGETTEQTNSRMSRYSNTRNMGQPNRLDRVTEGMGQWNGEKIDRMAKLLVNSLMNATSQKTRYESDFQRLKYQRERQTAELYRKVNQTLAAVEEELNMLTKKMKRILKAGDAFSCSQRGIELSTLIQQKTEQALKKKKELIVQRDQLSIMQDTPVVEQLPSILDHIQKEAIRCKYNRITTKTPLEISQKSLEGTYLVIRNLQRRIDQEAVSSKERIELRYQVRKQKEKAAKLIGIINDQLKCEDPKVTIEDCFKGVFPWQPAYQMSFQSNVKLINAWCLTERSQEEIILLKREMTNFFSGLKDIKAQLMSSIQELSQTPIGEDGFATVQSLSNGGRAVLMASEVGRINELLKGASHLFLDYVPVDSPASFFLSTEKDDVPGQFDYHQDPVWDDGESSDGRDTDASSTVSSSDDDCASIDYDSDEDFKPNETSIDYADVHSINSKEDMIEEFHSFSPFVLSENMI